MTLKIGIIMNPIETIHAEKDSTLAIMLAAQAYQHQLFYMEQKDLFLQNEISYAQMKSLKVFDDLTQWHEFQKEITAPLSDLDAILMRVDPPLDMQYIHTTQLLDRAEKAGVCVVNRPQSLRDFNEKLFATIFPQCIPPTLVTANVDLFRDFLKTHRDIILKPLTGMGGQSIFHVRENEHNLSVILENMTQHGTTRIMAQKFIPEITKGDKRILLIDGVPMEYALARIPSPGETRGSIAAGAKGVAVKLTERDRWICNEVSPVLIEKGLFFVGLDVIGDYLTEINITSPTCIREIEAQQPIKIADRFVEALEKRVVVDKKEHKK